MADKEKLSRALGTAFLTHQVAQLEREVLTGHRKGEHPLRGGPGGRGGRGRGRGGIRGGGPRIPTSTDTYGSSNKTTVVMPRKWTRDGVGHREEKVADRIVVDASVLVHALGKVREWSRDGRKEVVVIPLEALNTLDLLKKGTSPIAIRARQASRFLEAQVGVNHRVIVQRDDGYIPWDQFQVQQPVSRDSDPESDPSSDDRASFDMPRSLPIRNGTGPIEPQEWLKRTICCAKFEHIRPIDPKVDTSSTLEDMKIVLAIVCVSDDGLQNGGRGGRYDNRAAGVTTKEWATKVGLGVLDVEAEFKPRDRTISTEVRRGDDAVSGEDQVTSDQGEHHEAGARNRMSGNFNEGKQTERHPPASPRSGGHQRQFSGTSDSFSQPDMLRPWSNSGKNGFNNSPRKNSFGGHSNSNGPGSPFRGRGGKPHPVSTHLVEKPAAPIPLTKAGLLPAGKVIRLLARGEKLEPDP